MQVPADPPDVEALTVAALDGDNDRVRELLSGVDVNAEDASIAPLALINSATSDRSHRVKQNHFPLKSSSLL